MIDGGFNRFLYFYCFAPFFLFITYKKAIAHRNRVSKKFEGRRAIAAERKRIQLHAK